MRQRSHRCRGPAPILAVVAEGEPADLPSWEAVPGLAPSAVPRPVLFTVEVDGETFAVREDSMGVASDDGCGFSYEWLTGPNERYGFGAWGPPSASPDVHVERIRFFLRDIDPATGYLRED